MSTCSALAARAPPDSARSEQAHFIACCQYKVLAIPPTMMRSAMVLKTFQHFNFVDTLALPMMATIGVAGPVVMLAERL